MSSEGTAVHPMARSPFERTCAECGAEIAATKFAPRVQRRVSVTVGGMKGEKIEVHDFCDRDCLARWKERNDVW